MPCSMYYTSKKPNLCICIYIYKIHIYIYKTLSAGKDAMRGTFSLLLRKLHGTISLENSLKIFVKAFESSFGTSISLAFHFIFISASAQEVDAGKNLYRESFIILYNNKKQKTYITKSWGLAKGILKSPNHRLLKQILKFIILKIMY